MSKSYKNNASKMDLKANKSLKNGRLAKMEKVRKNMERLARRTGERLEIFVD